MPAISEARIAANRANALKSTGPKTQEGKEQSRRNALKHGLTGEGIALPNEDVAEVERRAVAFEAELQPSGELGRSLVRRIATLSVRMDRGVSQETAALSERVRRAIDEFEVPEGVDAATVAQLRAEAGARAMFDPSKEATLARKYEAAAERSFFRALKELRQVEKQAKAEPSSPEAGSPREALGSFLPGKEIQALLDSLPAEPSRVAPSNPSKPVAPVRNPSPFDSFEVPISIGRAR